MTVPDGSPVNPLYCHDTFTRMQSRIHETERAATKDESVCMAPHPSGLVCTRRAGHTRNHIAHHLRGYIVKTWETSSAKWIKEGGV